MIYSDITYDPNHLYKNQNAIKKELSKRNIKRKILLDIPNFANKSINWQYIDNFFIIRIEYLFFY